jgi:long-chain acyl-CoA synthetase
MLCELETGDLDLSGVRYAMTGGQFLDLGLVDRIRGFFPGTRVVNMYGCSENSPRIAYHYVDGRSGMDDEGYFAVGRAVEGTEIRIAGDDGRPIAPGAVGEVHVRGTSLMRGYWRDTAATHERIRDGWFNSRDLGYFDRDGNLHLTGRTSSIINIGNEKVSPEEVEKVLSEVPGVAEAAVYGVSDPLLGEAVHAQVVPKPGAQVLTQDLRAHCRRKVSGYKVPRRIHVVSTLPKTHYGKIDRARLRDPE